MPQIDPLARLYRVVAFGTRPVIPLVLLYAMGAIPRWMVIAYGLTGVGLTLLYMALRWRENHVRLRERQNRSDRC